MNFLPTAPNNSDSDSDLKVPPNMHKCMRGMKVESEASLLMDFMVRLRQISPSASALGQPAHLKVACAPVIGSFLKKLSFERTRDFHSARNAASVCNEFLFIPKEMCCIGEWVDAHFAFEMNIPWSGGGIIKRDIILAFQLEKHSPSTGLVCRMLAIWFNRLLNHLSYTFMRQELFSLAFGIL